MFFEPPGHASYFTLRKLGKSAPKARLTLNCKRQERAEGAFDFELQERAGGAFDFELNADSAILLPGNALGNQARGTQGLNRWRRLAEDATTRRRGGVRRRAAAKAVVTAREASPWVTPALVAG